MNLYEELGRIQFQLDKLETSKAHIVRQIEIQMTVESIKQQTQNEANQTDDSKSPS